MRNNQSKAQHPSANSLAKSGFFKGIKSWSQLKNKISKLHENCSKVEGDAFEVFCEMYLKVIMKAKRVIPSSEFTSQIKKKYRYPSVMPDAGADGLYLAQNGEWTAYQAKFRSNQKTLTWGELGTFFGLTEYTPLRHVMTTCQEIVGSVDEMKGHDGRFFSTREEDFDRLTEEQFDLMNQWLVSGTVKKSKPVELRPYQDKAVKNIIKHLKTDNRTQTIMACGTGKTLVALTAAKKMKPNKVVVFVPSLTLLKQIYLDWMKNHWDGETRYLAVCSDKKITGRETQDKLTDAQFPATTDVKVLRKQLKGAKKFVIFCTYASSKVLNDLKVKFDLGIFDEAHRTVGFDFKHSANSLFDDNVKIDKRLFLTATPRNHRYAERENIVSMDNESVYGRRNTELLFSEAKKIRPKVICDFKIVVTAITTSDVNRYLLETHGTKVKHDDVHAIHVANQLAVKMSMEKYKINKIFSFHNRRSEAKKFVAKDGEGINSHIPDIETFYVEGHQSSGERYRRLKEFANAKKAICSNAKCLTEGVDVPAVDCVAFIQPKKSGVDIVQAVGRAMRMHRGKKFGYLLVPIYIEERENESLEESLDRTDFERVVAVARAMAQNSDELEELLELHSVNHRRRKKGSKKKSELLQVLANQLVLEQIKRAITTRVLDRLRNPWEVRYGELQQFLEDNNGQWPMCRHVKFPKHESSYTSEHRQSALARWVSIQRKYFDSKHPRLTQAKIDKLNQIGMVWNLAEHTWSEKLRLFKSLTVDVGHTQINGKTFISQRVAKDWNPKNKKPQPKLDKQIIKQIDVWATNLKTVADLDNEPHPLTLAYKDTSITNEKIQHLRDIGFCFDIRQELAYIQTRKLERYYKEHKSFYVTHSWTGYEDLNPDKQRVQGLGVWTSRARRLKKEGKLNPITERGLNSIGFEWEQLSLTERTFNRMYEYAKKYHKKHGHINVARGESRVDCIETQFKLWINNLRARKLKGRLTKNQIKKLDALGMIWNPVGEKREKHLNIIRKAGTTKLPTDQSKSNPFREVVPWIAACRKLKKTGHLSSYIEKELNKIPDMDWEPTKDVFETNFEEYKNFLEKFKRFPKNGNHGNRTDGEEARLNRWQGTQSKFYKQKKLSRKRIKMLKSIDFPFYGIEEYEWDKNYELAKLYYKDHGHINLPQLSNSKNTSGCSGLWVAGQRAKYRKGKLSKEKIKKLNALKINWNPSEVPFYEKVWINPRPLKSSNGKTYESYSIDLGKCPVTGKNPVIQYSYKDLAEKALEFVKKKGKRWNKSLIELRDLCYKKIPHVRREKRCHDASKVKHLLIKFTQKDKLNLVQTAQKLNALKILTAGGKKWNNKNVRYALKSMSVGEPSFKVNQFS